jgi:hypothetical protein
MIACSTGLAVSSDKSSQSELGRRVAAALSKPNHCQACGDQPGNPAPTMGPGTHCVSLPEQFRRSCQFFFIKAPVTRATTGNQTISAELFNQFGFFGRAKRISRMNNLKY